MIDSGFRFHAGSRAAGQRGVTLIELLIVIAIVGTLAAMAMPSFSSLLRDQRIKAAVSEVNSSIIYARSEAIKRNHTVAICAKNSDGSGCGNTTNWSVGWIIFLDADGNGYPGAVADIIKKQDAFTGVTVTGTGSNLSYQRDGRLAAAVSDFVVSITGSTSRCVSISLSGQPHTKPTC